MLINLTNHPSSGWAQEQLAAAEKYGAIIDLPFPDTDPRATPEEIAEIARSVSAEILAKPPAAVLCQGEATLSFAITARLLAANIPVISATCERVSEEFTTPDGATVKKAIFKFVGFREYRK